MATSVSKSFTAVNQVSGTISRAPGVAGTLLITGTFVATLVLESSINNGATWQVRDTYTATQALIRLPEHGSYLPNTIIYRLRCSAYTSGTAVTTLATLDALPSSIPAAINVATVAGASALALGATLTSGLQFYEVEEVVTLASAGAKFVAMTCVIPAGAIILAAQMNIDVLVVAGGTSVKVGLGLNGGTCNTWGNTGDLLANTKADLLGTTVLALDTTPEVCACASTATGLGDTNFSAGSVRVRITYLRAVSLPNV